jgi:hypothetical protein
VIIQKLLQWIDVVAANVRGNSKCCVVYQVKRRAFCENQLGSAGTVLFESEN